MAPTLEAYCNNETATSCPIKCHQDSFLGVTAVGHHVILHPPPGSAREAIQHYLAEKDKSPKTTSGILILPSSRGRKQPWTPFLKGMELLKQYTSQDRIFRKVEDGGKLTSYSGHIDVWYDPPIAGPDTIPEPFRKLALLSARTKTAGTEMLFASSIRNHQAISLVDTGAPHCYMHEGFFRKLELPVEQPPDPVEEILGAGTNPLRILGKVHVPLRMGSYSANIEFQVVHDLLPGIDMILGLSWQIANKVVSDPARRRIKISTPGRKAITLRSLNSARTQTISGIRNFLVRTKDKNDEVSTMTAKQANRAIKSGAEHMMIHVRTRPDPQHPGTVSTPWHETTAPWKRMREPHTPMNDSPDLPDHPDVVQPTLRRKVTESYHHIAAARTSGTGSKLIPDTQRDPAAEGDISVSQNKGGESNKPGKAGSGPPHTNDNPNAHGLIDEPKLTALLEEFQDVFPPELPSGLPPDRQTGHVIPLEPNAIPPYRRNRRMSPNEVELCKDYITDLLMKGFISPSTSPFGAPVMFIAKPAGGYRVVCDWRALNNITVKNRYPLPRIDETLDRLGGAKIFSSLDLNSGYFQIRISPEDAHKTAFTTPIGQYEFKVLGQGLANSPATFQSVMNRIFAPHLHKFVVVYLDDIMIFSDTPDEHIQHIRTVLELLREHRLYAKKEKCTFNRTEVKFLGHLVGREGLRVDPTKVDSVKNWPEPVDVTQVRQFLGLTNYFRKFIKDYSTLAAPLNDLTRKDTNFRDEWNDTHRTAFQQLKDALTSAPVLILPDFTKPFELVSDASLLGTGAILFQEGQVVAYTSRKFTSAEKNYTTTEQEMLGIVTALEEWRCYLGASPLTLVTDHNPLTYFETKVQLSRRLARWAEFMAQFSYKWEYRAGRNNVADPISRSPALMCFQHVAVLRPYQLRPRKATEPIPKRKYVRKTAPAIRDDPEPVPVPEQQHHPDEHSPENPIVNPASSSDSQDSDEEPMVDIVKLIRSGYAADPKFAAEQLKKKYTQVDNLWIHNRKVVVPNVPVLRKRLIHETHTPPYSGHAGQNRTLELLSRTFYWPKMRDNVEEFVRACRLCQQNKSLNKSPGGLLQSSEIPEKFWETVTMDFITQLPETRCGNDAILVFVDKLSKMTKIIPCTTSITAVGTAKLFVEHVIKDHGLPIKIISDRDPRFTSLFWQAICDALKIRTAMSTAFHPQTDGQTERMNRVIEDALRHFVNPLCDDWDEYLAAIQFAINNSWNSSIENTPFHAVYGQHPHTPLTLSVRTNVPTAQQWLQKFSDRTAEAKASLRKAQNRQKSYADRSRRAVKYSLDDYVWLSTKNIRFSQVPSSKFLPRYLGPFRIIKLVGPRDPDTQEIREVTACKLELPPTFRIHPVFHVCLLKPYVPDGRPIHRPPTEVDMDGVPTYVAEAIVGEKLTKEKDRDEMVRYFKVHWKGYTPESDSWEPESYILGPELIPRWRETHPGPLPLPLAPICRRATSGRPYRTQPKPNVVSGTTLS